MEKVNQLDKVIEKDDLASFFDRKHILKGNVYEDFVFKECDLSGRYFDECVFTNCIFERCKLFDNTFEDCVIVGTKFNECTYCKVEFKKSCLTRTTFDKNCSDWRVSFNSCTMYNARFIDSRVYRDPVIDQGGDWDNRMEFHACQFSKYSFKGFKTLPEKLFWQAKQDLFLVMLQFPEYIDGLIDLIKRGKLDGSLYGPGTEGHMCVFGYLNHASGKAKNYEFGPEECVGIFNCYTELEKWVNSIHVGDRPAGNVFSAMLLNALFELKELLNKGEIKPMKGEWTLESNQDKDQRKVGVLRYKFQVQNFVMWFETVEEFYRDVLESLASDRIQLQIWKGMTTEFIQNSAADYLVFVQRPYGVLGQFSKIEPTALSDRLKKMLMKMKFDHRVTDLALEVLGHGDAVKGVRDHIWESDDVLHLVDSDEIVVLTSDEWEVIDKRIVETNDTWKALIDRLLSEENNYLRKGLGS